jgi:carbon storage regulator
MGCYDDRYPPNPAALTTGNGISRMLILSRRESERVHLGDDIILTIVRVNGDKVRIGVEAPSHIKILRTELERTIEASPPVTEQSPNRRAA